MPIYERRCPERYTLGAHVLFLVCMLDDAHEGNHWDAPLEVAWSTAKPDAPDACTEPSEREKG